MKTSVIIPTYNGAHKLPGIINAIRKQVLLPDEVIIVVDGSIDNTIEVLNSMNLTSNFKTVVQQNKGRAAVRNRGVEEASGDLIIFFDDDMLPKENCLKVHVEHHKAYSFSILTGAQIDKPEDVTDFQLFKHKLSLRWTKSLYKYEHVPMPPKQVFITAANFSIRKDLFHSIGGFDFRLRDTEDFDFAVRAVRQGVQLYYNHNAFAWHVDKMNCTKYIKRLREYYRANKKLALLKPWLIEEGFFNVPEVPRGVKGMAFKAFCSPFWIQSIDNPGWILLLPKQLRYRIYNYVTTANGVYYPDIVKL